MTEEPLRSSGDADATPRLHAVTGAFGYSGRYITQRLLAADHPVRTLTGSPDREHDFGDQVDVRPFTFDDHAALVESLRGVEVLINTYWVRFNTSRFNQTDAVANTKAMFRAAVEAGVRRVVHVSITNPLLDSPHEYFRGKAELEQALIDSGMSYAILRPAVLFGGEDILVNNIAWCLRHVPIFMIPGDGQYRLQPIHVDDLAQLAVEQGGRNEDVIIDATGPETFTYRELIQTVGQIIGRPRRTLHVAPGLAHACGWLIGHLVGDVLITREEVRGLMDDLLATESPPAGTTRLTDWAKCHAATLGVRYASELARRKNRRRKYGNL